MAYLPRLVRLNNLKNYVTFVRNLTSNNISSGCTIPKVISTNQTLITQIAETNNAWIWQKNDKVESPILNKLQIDFPNGLKYVPPQQDPSDNKELELPSTPNSNVTKQAARLIVIRRKKMKRHKLKKLRKRMKFENAKRRQRREWNKEKVFQAELIQQCKEGEAFSAEKYVAERLAKFNELTTLEQSKSRKRNLKDKQV